MQVSVKCKAIMAPHFQSARRFSYFSSRERIWLAMSAMVTTRKIFQRFYERLIIIGVVTIQWTNSQKLRTQGEHFIHSALPRYAAFNKKYLIILIFSGGTASPKSAYIGNSGNTAGVELSQTHEHIEETVFQSISRCWFISVCPG